MDGGFAYLDIVLLAMVAAVLIYRLRSVLGRRTGTEKRPPDPFQAPTEPRRLPQTAQKAGAQKTATQPPSAQPAPEKPAAATGAAETPTGALAQGLRQITAADPAFTPESFLAGARAAFSWIVEAFAKGDAKALRPLLHDDVYNNFAAAIEARTRAGETHETTLVAVKSVDILEARMQNRIAFVTAKFVSEQVNVTRNREGEVIEGDPVRVVAITDIWTFARDTRSRDPNWSLVATRSSN